MTPTTSFDPIRLDPTGQAADSQAADSPAIDPQLLEALSGLHADASMAMVQRTRRAVRDAALSARQARRTRRRNAGIATLVVLSFLIVLSPALWNVADALVRGESISDLTPMVTLLVVLVLSGVLAALVAGWKSPHPMRHTRRKV